MGRKNGKQELSRSDFLEISKASKMTEAQVMQCYREFIIVHPEGRITKEGFRKVLPSSLNQSDFSKIEKHAFRICDLNDDGYIDFTEFMAFFFLLAWGDYKDVLRKMFRLFDINGDGCITKKEMKILVNAIYGILKANDPGLSKSDDVAMAAFDEMDKNRDDKITEDEFFEACINDEWYSKLITSTAVELFVEDDYE